MGRGCILLASVFRKIAFAVDGLYLWASLAYVSLVAVVAEMAVLEL